jgi:hypothetical protein
VNDRVADVCRQRCCWFGEVIDEFDLGNTFSSDGQLSAWPVGSLVRCGPRSRVALGLVVVEVTNMPADWCGAQPQRDNVVRGQFGGAL